MASEQKYVVIHFIAPLQVMSIFLIGSLFFFILVFSTLIMMCLCLYFSEFIRFDICGGS